MSWSRRLPVAAAAALAVALAGCGAAAEPVTGPPLGPAGSASPSGYAASVRKGADALRDFARELDRLTPATLDDRVPELEAIRTRYDAAVRESAEATAPTLLADADRRLVAAFRDVDVAMGDVVAAARANDPERYDRARASLVEVAQRIDRAAGRFAAAAR